MGGTRKSFYIAELIFEIVKYLILTVFLAISYKFQKQIYNKAGKESCLINEHMDKYINIGSVLLLIGFVIALMMLLSALAVMYKEKVYIIIWIVYLVVCMIPVQLHNLEENDNDSMPARFALYDTGISGSRKSYSFVPCNFLSYNSKERLLIQNKHLYNTEYKNKQKLTYNGFVI